MIENVRFSDWIPQEGEDLLNNLTRAERYVEKERKRLESAYAEQEGVEERVARSPLAESISGFLTLKMQIEKEGGKFIEAVLKQQKGELKVWVKYELFGKQVQSWM